MRYSCWVAVRVRFGEEMARSHRRSEDDTCGFSHITFHVRCLQLKMQLECCSNSPQLFSPPRSSIRCGNLQSNPLRTRKITPSSSCTGSEPASVFFGDIRIWSSSWQLAIFQYCIGFLTTALSLCRVERHDVCMYRMVMFQTFFFPGLSPPVADQHASLTNILTVSSFSVFGLPQYRSSPSQLLGSHH